MMRFVTCLFGVMSWLVTLFSLSAGVFSLLSVAGNSQAVAKMNTLRVTQLNPPELNETSPNHPIRWELRNPFRLFKDPALTELHSILRKGLSEEERQTPILSIERRLAAEKPHGWAEMFFDKTCWSRNLGSYHNCDGEQQSYLHPKSHEIWAEYQTAAGETAAGDATTGAAKGVGKQCQWQLLEAGSDQLIGEPMARPCDERVNFTVPYPQGARLAVATDEGKRFIQTIKVEDVFIVGIGDSFGSGDGNPDVPVRFSSERSVIYGGKGKGDQVKRAYPTRAGDWREVADAEFMKRKALWLGQSCHRSLYSHQIRASLELALSNPQRAVTFVGFACAGAEITHGMFLRFKGNEWSLSPPRLSQISAVAKAQCGANVPKPTIYSRAFGVDGKLDILHDLTVLKCDRERARKIDLLMVSIGGNDVSFSSLVANVVVKNTINLKTIGGWMGAILNSDQASYRTSELKLRYKALRRAFHNVLQIPWKEADRILLTAYPNMTFRDKGQKVCDNGSLGMTVSPVFSLAADKAGRAEKFANRLNRMMKRVARDYKWTFVDEHREAFTSHGICARNEERLGSLAENLHLPFYENGKWSPFNPADYAPYASRERWFRTPNDAYLTGHLHLSGPVIRNIFKIQNFSQLQVLIAGTYSGAFHPTAEGQAVIADALAIAADKVLKKYGQ